VYGPYNKPETTVCRRIKLNPPAIQFLEQYTLLTDVNHDVIIRPLLERDGFITKFHATSSEDIQENPIL
jgi:hypothetical protein